MFFPRSGITPAESSPFAGGFAMNFVLDALRRARYAVRKSNANVSQ
jgi:hypothetical protein